MVEKPIAIIACVILEIGSCIWDDDVNYPDDDIQAEMGQDGNWGFAHKDGKPY